MRHVTFFRITALPGQGLKWLTVADYPVADAPDNDTAIEIAQRRLKEDRGLSSWENIADISLVRVS